MPAPTDQKVNNRIPWEAGYTYTWLESTAAPDERGSPGHHYITAVDPQHSPPRPPRCPWILPIVGFMANISPHKLAEPLHSTQTGRSCSFLPLLC